MIMSIDLFIYLQHIKFMIYQIYKSYIDKKNSLKKKNSFLSPCNIIYN